MLLYKLALCLSCVMLLCISSDVPTNQSSLKRMKRIRTESSPNRISPKRFKRKNLLQAYKTYTKRNCLEFKEFVKRVRFKPRVPKFIENLGYFQHLEDLNENELVELLAKLELDENDFDISSINPQGLNVPVDDIDEDILETDDDYYQQKQEQEASQQVQAEIHTHSHYYLLVPENGTIMQIPALDGQNLTSVQNMLSETTTTTTTQSPITRPTVALLSSTTMTVPTSLPTSTNLPFSTLDSTSPNCHCPSGLEDSENLPPYNKYTNETQDVTFTTLRPDSRPATSTVKQTTLPPVSVPTAGQTPSTTSTPVTYPPGFPTPEDTDGAFTCGGSSSGATTNFVSPQYPNFISNTGTCDFYLVIAKPVCQVRVDFVDTEMLGPLNGSCVAQELTVEGTIWPMGVQSFCGRNNGQHFYIEVKQGSDLTYIKFSVSTRQQQSYKWGLWLTQLRCNDDSELLAPAGCFQYYFRGQDVITSFNYVGGQYFSNQDYRICILAEADKCAIKIEANGPFMLEKFGNYKTFPFTRSGVSSTYCVLDYILIPGGKGQGGSTSHDRFCGGELSSTHGAMESETIITQITSRLATLEFHSGKRSGVYYTAQHVGFRLVYTQVREDCSRKQVAFSQEQLLGVTTLPGQNSGILTRTSIRQTLGIPSRANIGQTLGIPSRANIGQTLGIPSRTSLATSATLYNSDTLLNKMMSYYLYPNEPRQL